MSDELTDACRTGDVARVQACIARGVDVNSKCSLGKTPLIESVSHDRLEIVRLLLARDELYIGEYDFGETALHYACLKGSAGSVALLGQDMRMSSQILNTRDITGETALMLAVYDGHLSCVEEMAKLDGVDWEMKNGKEESLEDVARLRNNLMLLKFLKKVQEEKDSPSRCKKIKLTKLTEALENVEEKMKAEEILLIDKHKKKKRDFEGECARQREDLENELREKLSAMHESITKERECLANEHENLKKALKKEIKAVVSTLTALPPAPECPICLDSLAPPVRLYNCPEGHLLCSECRTKVKVCQLCRKPLQGRATAMEQYLRAVYGVE